MKLSLQFVFLLILILESCVLINTRNEFYTDRMAEYDLWRIPVVYPYELVTSECCATWSLSCIYKDSCLPDPHDLLGTIDSINYYENKILFSTPGSNNTSSYTWGYIDPQNGNIHAFYSYEKFINSTNSIGIGHELYFTDSLHKYWNRTEKLPWDNRIKKLIQLPTINRYP